MSLSKEQRLVLPQAVRLEQVTKRQGDEVACINRKAAQKGYGNLVTFSAVRDVEKVNAIGKPFHEGCEAKAYAEGEEKEKIWNHTLILRKSLKCRRWF